MPLMMTMPMNLFIPILFVLLIAANLIPSVFSATVANSLTKAKRASGEFISWVEHPIDTQAINQQFLRGADGLAIADLDGDNHQDIVSVHEDSNHIRIAFGDNAVNSWHSVTLAQGELASQAEDVDIGDLDGDGHKDIVIALESGGIVAFKYPGKGVRNVSLWTHSLAENTRNRGSFIRVALADFNSDGQLEVVAANKGFSHNKAGKISKPGITDYLKVYMKERLPVSIFYPTLDSLASSDWPEQVISELRMPINAEPIDLDKDGDIDIVAGGRGHQGILWLKNDKGSFSQHWLNIDGWWSIIKGGLPFVTGQTLAFADINRDGRLDIITQFNLDTLGWLEQPKVADSNWRAHIIGKITPDHIAAIVPADVDGDGVLDIFVGGYSKGNRQQDDLTDTANSPLGRLAWFKQTQKPTQSWQRFDISRRVRGMYDDLIPLDIDKDGDIDFVGTRGNSAEFDGVFWLEQVQTIKPKANFKSTRTHDSQQVSLGTK